jgi:hypothetical protein
MMTTRAMMMTKVTTIVDFQTAIVTNLMSANNFAKS